MWPLDITWTFVRGDDQLRLRRVKTDGGVLVVETIASDRGTSDRSHFFRDLEPVIQFEKILIAQLEENGWMLIDFSPERRSGVERRKANGRGGADRRQNAARLK